MIFHLGSVVFDPFAIHSSMGETVCVDESAVGPGFAGDPVGDFIEEREVWRHSQFCPSSDGAG